MVAKFFARDYMETPSVNPGYAPETMSNNLATKLSECVCGGDGSQSEGIASCKQPRNDREIS